MNSLGISILLVFTIFCIYSINASLLSARVSDVERCFLDQNCSAQIVTHNNSDFDYFNFQWHFRNQIKPLGFILVQSSSDVQSVVRCAQKLKLKTSVKSGGHGMAKYAYGSDEHWVVDVSNLNSVEVDTKTKTVTAGAGTDLHSLSFELWEKAQSGLPIGSCYSVGIAGFALGGGFGVASRKYGLMSDRIRAIEIVTADGKIRRLSRRKHRDLFWALRGSGGGNFGIVTKFTFESFEIKYKVIVLKKIYDAEHFELIFYTWQKLFASNLSRSITSRFKFNHYSNPNKIFLIFVIFNSNFTRSLQHLDLLRNYFPNITSDDVKIRDFYEMQSDISTPYTKSGATSPYLGFADFFVSKILSKKQVALLREIVSKHPFMFMSIDPFGGAINKVNSTSTAFVHRNAYYNVLLGFGLQASENKTLEQVVSEGEEKNKLIERVVKTLSFMDNGESYQNFIDPDLEHWERRYYGQNLEQLIEIKKKYDPSNFFSFAQNIPLYHPKET